MCLGVSKSCSGPLFFVAYGLRAIPVFLMYHTPSSAPPPSGPLAGVPISGLVREGSLLCFAVPRGCRVMVAPLCGHRDEGFVL
jgi:hypothetical protein